MNCSFSNVPQAQFMDGRPIHATQVQFIFRMVEEKLDHSEFTS